MLDIDIKEILKQTKTVLVTQEAFDELVKRASAQPEIIRCKDCIYYDPPHVEDNGERREYEDMPNEAFDELGTGFVNMSYGINVGGRCTRDYNTGYTEDKRVYVGKDNYCGRARRRKSEEKNRRTNTGVR